MAYWLKVAGNSQEPFVHDDWQSRHRQWRETYGEIAAFPANRRPSRMRRGDRLVHYAAGSAERFREGRVYGVWEVLSSRPEPSPHERWPWMVRTRFLVGAPLLSVAPTLSQIGVDSKSVRRQSHIQLTREQGRRAEELISRAAGKGGGGVVARASFKHAKPAADVLTLGRTAEVVDVESGRVHRWTLVASAEADLTRGRLSIDSPVGSALSDCRTGRTVEVSTPRGNSRLKVVRLID